MEPITTVSTILLCSSLLTAPKTAHLNWLSKGSSDPHLSTETDRDDHSIVVMGTRRLVAPDCIMRPATSTPILNPSRRVNSELEQIVDLKDELYSKLVSYLPGYPGGDHSIVSREAEIVTAIRLIRILPAGIPLPQLMRNEDGDVGMYWDDGVIFMDVNIEPDGVFSLFSVDRSQGAAETFLPGQQIEAIDSNWAFRAFHLLTRNMAEVLV